MGLHTPPWPLLGDSVLATRVSGRHTLGTNGLRGYVVGIFSGGTHPMDLRAGGTTTAITGPATPRATDQNMVGFSCAWRL